MTTTKRELIKNGFTTDIIQAAVSLGIELDTIEDAYCGQFDSAEEFAQGIADSLGLLDTEQAWPYSCIDWEYAARELMYDYVEEDGYYFRDV